MFAKSSRVSQQSRKYRPAYTRDAATMDTNANPSNTASIRTHMESHVSDNQS